MVVGKFIKKMKYGIWLYTDKQVILNNIHIFKSRDESKLIELNRNVPLKPERMCLCAWTPDLSYSTDQMKANRTSSTGLGRHTRDMCRA